jgi:hypothetical protein
VTPCDRYRMRWDSMFAVLFAEALDERGAPLAQLSMHFEDRVLACVGNRRAHRAAVEQIAERQLRELVDLQR